MTDVITVEYYVWTGLFVGVALLMWWLSHKFGERVRSARVKQGHGIHIVETAFLSPHQKIHVVKIAGEKYVITTGRNETSVPVKVANEPQSIKQSEPAQ